MGVVLRRSRPNRKPGDDRPQPLFPQQQEPDRERLENFAIQAIPHHLLRPYVMRSLLKPSPSLR